MQAATRIASPPAVVASFDAFSPSPVAASFDSFSPPPVAASFDAFSSPPKALPCHFSSYFVFRAYSLYKTVNSLVELD